MKKVQKSFRMKPETIEYMEYIAEKTNLNRSQVLDLIFDLVDSNFTIDTILLHYATIEKEIMSDGRNNRKKFAENS